MSDSSYADEFGKWLQNNPTQIEDSNDSSDNSRDREYAMNADHTLESDESEKLQKNLVFERGNKLSSGSISDQAPILVDDDDYDDDDLFSNKKQQYEDEPPVLEPVPDQLQSCKLSAGQNPQLSPQICMRSYSRNNRTHSKKNSQKEYKVSSNKDNECISPDLCEESRHIHSLKSKDSKSGNIFDKFISESYDSPPPLIPSPEVLQICSEPPSLLAKNPSHSPNFCAMEADSTSEINRDILGTSFQPHRPSKNFAHDVSVECDSTCMLAASPFIVSPASISNGDIEEPIDSGDGGRDEASENNGDKKMECDNALEIKTESENQSTLVHNTISQCLVNEIIHIDAPEAKYCIKSSELKVTEQLQCNPDKPMLGISTFSNDDYRSLSVDVESNVSEYFAGPPTLSAVSPPSVRSHTRFRKGHYPDDSPKTFSRSRKRSYHKPPGHTDCPVMDVLSPPILNRVSETATITLRGRRSRVVSEHSQSECLNCDQDKTISQRSRRRCNSVPVTGGANSNDSLSENLHSFITGTSELSGLQTHMHKLLYRLFPQLKTELDAMSPESFKFEGLLSDLVKLLEQPDDQDSLTPPPLILCRDINTTHVYEHPRFSSELNCTYKNISGEPSSPLLSTSDSQAATADYAKIVLNSDAISCNHTSSSKQSSCNPNSSQSKQRRQVKVQQSEDKNLVAPLSRLSVRDMEEIITPSEVLLCKNPEPSLRRFVRLSCTALQLLLPDLPVSVYNELGQSPHDLVAFINSVILMNSKRRKKY